MSKLWLVAENEYRNQVLRKGFLFALLSVPLLITILGLVAGLLSPADGTGQEVTAGNAGGLALSAGQALPPLAGLILIVLIFISSGYLTQALVEEKANRTIEILTTSLSARQLVGGKLLGILGVTATQLAAWGLFALVAAIAGRQLLGLAWLQEISVDGRAVLLLVALLVPAYLFVAASMAAVGIAAPEARSSQQVVALLISLYLVPLGFILPVLGEPSSPLAVGLSLFPLTAPIVLPLRFALVPVPFWQVAAAVAIQSLLALGALWLATRALRLGLLRFGRGLHWRELAGMAAPQQKARPQPGATVAPLAPAARGAGQGKVHKTLLILRHELAAAVRRPVYLLMMAGLPLFLYLNTMVMQSATPGSGGSPADEPNISVLLLTRWLPSLIMLLLYGVIAMVSGMMLTSVSDEKKNRVIEVLLVSINPRQMLTGKIVALGIAGLLQAAVWIVLGYFLLGVVGPGKDLAVRIDLPPSLLVWSLVFMLLGYALYATLMAGAGALVPDVKESPFVTLMFYVPAFIGFEISLFSLESPHAILPTVASLFPLTAPFSMMHRLTVGGVPSWQLALSIVLILASIPLILHGVARMFQAQILLSGQPFSTRRYFQVLLGRAPQGV
jgi:ABC-type Na+ efflux pump permease subunit